MRKRRRDTLRGGGVPMASGRMAEGFSFPETVRGYGDVPLPTDWIVAVVAVLNVSV